MQILCCFTQLDPDTTEALAERVADFNGDNTLDLVNVSHSNTAYWEEISKRWTGLEDLVIVEHDIIIHESVLPEFYYCTELWCTFPYLLSPDGEPFGEGLGCVRFRAELQSMVTPAEIMAIPNGRLEPGHWNNLDGPITTAMGNHGIRAHVHQPPVEHHMWNRKHFGHIEYVGDGDGGRTSDAMG